MMRIGYVYFNDIFCGTLEENDEYIFTYDDSYNGKSISLLLPTSKKPIILKLYFLFLMG